MCLDQITEWKAQQRRSDLSSNDLTGFSNQGATKGLLSTVSDSYAAQSGTFADGRIWNSRDMN